MAAPGRGKEDEEEEYYAYQLVRFFTKNKKGEADVDCVPSTWISFNINTGKCECKYLPPPYDADDFDLLHEFVKKRAPPPESWPSYPITLRGHAKTYDEATKRLEILKLEDYAYTTDENTSKAAKAASDTKTYRTKVIKSNAELTKELLRVPRIRTSSADNRSTNASDKSNSSSNESSSDESHDEKENDCSTQDNNQKGPSKNVAEGTNKLNNPKFPRDEDYRREDPKKSLGSSGKQAPSKNSIVKASALHFKKRGESSGLPDASLKSKKGTDDSVSLKASSKSKKGTDASISPKASLNSKKRTDASISPKACLKSKERADASVSVDIHSSSIATNSNGVRALPLETSPPVAKKGTKESLVLALDALRVDIQTMTRQFKELKGVVQKSALAQDVFGANVQSFSSEYDVSLPIKTMDAFKDFDDRLQKEKKFRKEFTATLHYLVDPRTSMSKNITGILKKHLTRDVAINFTAVKASGEKSVFKDTSFCKCMLEVVSMKCKTIENNNATPITEKLYYHELGNALSNAVDWDGKRKERVTRRKPAQKSLAITDKEKEKEQQPERELEQENEKKDEN